NTFRVRQLVPQAALQAAAQTGQLRGIETQVLLLGHLDRDRLERGEECRAAQRPAARAVASDHLRLIADADLPHLDPGFEFGRKIVGDEALRTADGIEFHRDEPSAVLGRHSSSTSQSATILTPALRSSAASA